MESVAQAEISLPGTFPKARIFTREDVVTRPEAGYRALQYMLGENEYPYRAARLVPEGKAQEREVKKYERSLLVANAKNGEFRINGNAYPVNYQDLISLPMGTRYSFEMEEGARLFEFDTLPSAGTTYEPKIIRFADVAKQPGRIIDRRDNTKKGFVGYVYIANDEGHPHNAIWAYVMGASPPKKMTGAWRNYFVVDGKGAFTLNGNNIQVEHEDFLTIPPGNTYAFEGLMTLFEFNTPPSGPGTYHKV
jgi:mannose-6-phosphate isomerase-like protein (cupin superfamily)